MERNCWAFSWANEQRQVCRDDDNKPWKGSLLPKVNQAVSWNVNIRFVFIAQIEKFVNSGLELATDFVRSF